VALALVLGLAGTAQVQGGNQSAAEALLELDRPLVIAHRGYSEIAPENTLKSFELGVISGADLIELDYHAALGGEEIVIHDATVDRTTNAVAQWGHVGVNVSETDLEALQTLDAGSWFSPAFFSEKLPTLEEALRLIQGMGGVTLIERKAGPADSCARILKENGWVNALIVQSFDWDYLRDLRAELPDQVLGALGPGKVREGRKLTREERELSPAWIDAALDVGVQVVGWNGYVNKAAIDYAHEQGLKVWVYTINEMEKAQQLMDMGVDGIITNNPSIVWKAQALEGK
jgi:glycerophosphoryl diester phosphodiesterase